MYKLQYPRTSAEGCTAGFGSGLHSQPSIGEELGQVYGEFVKYGRKSVRCGRDGAVFSHAGSEISSEKADDVDRSSETTVKKLEYEQDAGERRDSGKESTHSSSTSQQMLNIKAIEASSSSIRPAIRASHASNTPYTSTNPAKAAESTLHLSLHTQYLIKDLPNILSTCHTAELRSIRINHYIIFCADNEEEAFTRQATTIFNTHRDDSISVLCYFDLDTGLGCICPIESVLATLVGEEAAREEQDPMQAKRKMWRRLSSASRVPQMPVGLVNFGGVTWTPLLGLVAKFAGLLRPKLGCDPHLEGTKSGLEAFERPVCSAEGVLLEALGGCGRSAFYVGERVDGVDVDVSGYGKRA